MTIISAVCWGSWANTFKGTRGFRFELFYWDYAIGIFVSALILAFTMGSMGHDSSSFTANVQSADTRNMISAMVGGAIFNLANLLLMAAVDLAGLAVAFPVAIGIALVVGVLLNYVQEHKGNAAVLAAGVACALIAVILDGKAYGHLKQALTKTSSTGTSSAGTSRKSIILCVVSGVLMGLWSPFSTFAMTRGNALTPYSGVVFLTLGALLSCFIWNLYFMKHPIVGEPVSLGGFFGGPASGHLLGLLGGIIWGTGTVFNLTAGRLTGQAISYAIGQSSPMVAALWGVFAWKEFEGSGTRAKVYLALMFVFYGLAILLVARANG